MISQDARYGENETFFLNFDDSEILSEITIDDYEFKVTLNAWIEGHCVLWFRDKRSKISFEALGRFTRFDKRDVLFFISRYATSPELREEIEARRFEKRLDNLNLSFFDDIRQFSETNKIAAFRNLFNLDSEIDSKDLARRRRIMARKFHPDVGGDHQAMTLINEAYEYLTQTMVVS